MPRPGRVALSESWSQAESLTREAQADMILPCLSELLRRASMAGERSLPIGRGSVLQVVPQALHPGRDLCTPPSTVAASGRSPDRRHRVRSSRMDNRRERPSGQSSSTIRSKTPVAPATVLRFAAESVRAPVTVSKFFARCLP